MSDGSLSQSSVRPAAAAANLELKLSGPEPPELKLPDPKPPESKLLESFLILGSNCQDGIAQNPVLYLRAVAAAHAKAAVRKRQ